LQRVYALQTQISKHPRCKRGRVVGCKHGRVVSKKVSSYALQTQISKHPRYKRGRVAGGVGRIILVLKTTKPLAYCERLCCYDSVY